MSFRVGSKEILIATTVMTLAGSVAVGTKAFAQNDQAPLSVASPAQAASSKQADDKKNSNAAAPAWQAAHDNAVFQARQGDLDASVAALGQLHNQHPEDLTVTRDLAAISSWAGHDADAVAFYQSLPPEQPDYVLESIAHSYRNLHQPEKALAIYQAGRKQSPDNVNYTAGEIEALLELNRIDEALQRVDDAQKSYPTLPDALATAVNDARHAQAAQMARDGRVKEALPILGDLHAKRPDDLGITKDYIFALALSGDNKNAVELYRTLPANDHPVWIVAPIGKSLRNMKRSAEAVTVYRDGLKQSPDNVDLTVGLIYSLSESGKQGEALDLAKATMAKHPEKPKELVDAYKFVQRQRAGQLARSGHYDQALSILRTMRDQYPGDSTEILDYISILSWSGRDAEAVKQYEHNSSMAMPDYVLQAVAHSYRNLRQMDKALAVYQRGLRQSPSNVAFAGGELRCLVDLSRYEEALRKGKQNLEKYGQRLEILLATGDAADRLDMTYDALNYYVRAVDIAPKNHEALHGLIRAEERVGASQLAQNMSTLHPYDLSSVEKRRIDGDVGSELTRWSPLEPRTEAERFVATDKAINYLDNIIQRWKGEGPEAYPDIQRARFDRLLALRDRVRMQEVVDDYNALMQEGVKIPGYALEPVGDAYLYLRQPEKAREIYQQVLAELPNDFEAKRQLAFTYVESDDFDQAYALIDKLQADEPKWIYRKNDPSPQPNINRAFADVDTANFRSYGGEYAAAQEKIEPILEAAPHESRNRAAAGEVYLQRGWPRRALEQFKIGAALQDGKDAANETGLALSNLALQNFQEAESKVQNLTERFPENLPVQRLQHIWDVHNMNEVDIRSFYAFRPTNSQQGSDGYGIDATYYSAPIDYNWRLFVGEDVHHQSNPNSEGSITLFRSTAGAEYRNGPVTAQLGPTFDHYHGTEHAGVAGQGNISLNDQWTIGGGGEYLSVDTPLRALNAGVRAHSVNFFAEWRQSDERQLRANLEEMPFSDGNNRTSQSLNYLERLYTDPNFRVDGLANYTTTQNSIGPLANNYYNPSIDMLGLVGVQVTEKLYQRYETLYQHSLLLTPGFYWQRNNGSSAAWNVRYEHRLLMNETLEGAIGVDYSRQNFDSTPEDSVVLTVDLTKRF